MFYEGMTAYIFLDSNRSTGTFYYYVIIPSLKLLMYAPAVIPYME